MEFKVFENLFKHQKFQYCRVYDLEDSLMLTLGKENAAGDFNNILKDLKLFKKDCPGTYSIHCKKTFNLSDSHVHKYIVDFGETASTQGNPNYASMETEITARVKAELAGRSTNDQIKDLKGELDDMKYPLERLAVIATSVLDRLAPNLRTSLNKVNPDIVLQGTQAPVAPKPVTYPAKEQSRDNSLSLKKLLMGKNIDMSDTTQKEETEVKEYTQAEQKRVQDAVVAFLDVMTVDQFEKFAHKLNKEPQLVGTLEAML